MKSFVANEMDVKPSNTFATIAAREIKTNFLMISHEFYNISQKPNEGMLYTGLLQQSQKKA